MTLNRDIQVRAEWPPVRLSVAPAHPVPRPQDVGVLSESERGWLPSLPLPRAAEFAGSRALLRRLVAGLVGMPAPRVPLIAPPELRPRLEGLGLAVSLSHTTGYLAAAVWPGRAVGVDVQQPPAAVPAGLVRRCCGCEASAVLRMSDAVACQVFTRVWSVQEACVKATGAGLAGAPWRIPVELTASRGTWSGVWWTALSDLSPVGLAVAVRG